MYPGLELLLSALLDACFAALHTITGERQEASELVRQAGTACGCDGTVCHLHVTFS